MQRYEAKAEELGVTSRTVRRWARRYRDLGEAGLVDERGTVARLPLAGVDTRWADACRAVLDEQVDESSVTKDLTLRRVRARLDRDFGEGAVPAPQGGAAYRALDELSWGRGSFRGAPRAGARSPAAVGDLRAAALVTARRVRADGQHQAGRVRDGAGHAPLGAGRADGRDGPVHQVHSRVAGDPGVDQERRCRLGAF